MYGRLNDMILKFRAVKVEMNYSANQKRDDWRLGGFQSNTPSTEVINLLCWKRKIRKNFFRVTFSALINVNTSLFVNMNETHP